MKLIDELRSEHELIERAVGSLRTYAERRASDGSDVADAARFLRFFRSFAGQFHHAREEDVLFAALAERTELPIERGPVAVMLAEHARMAGLLDRLEPLLGKPALEAGDRARLRELATEYAHALWHHIDAENSVLLPESEARLKRHGVAELPTRPMSADERDARELGSALVERYPPASDLDAFRGDGCVACPAFGESCRGLEREWWNESEWEEFEDRSAGD